MSVLSYALYSTHLKNISSKASGHLTSSFTTEKFIGMELLQYRKKKPQVKQKIAEQNQDHREFHRIGLP
jgi:hypothetical protein